MTEKRICVNCVMDTTDSKIIFDEEVVIIAIPFTMKYYQNGILMIEVIKH